MGLAFWRTKKRATSAGDRPAPRPPLSQDDDADARLDSAAALRARARHRLIGAAALLLVVAIVVPMVLDPEPRPVSEDIPIDIPSERTPFAPRLALPAVPAADAAGTPPPDDAPRAPAGGTPASGAPESGADGAVAPSAAAKARNGFDARAASADEARVPKAEDKADAPRPDDGGKGTSAKSGKFVVQAAAPASEKSARDLAARLKKSGLTAYIEKVETKAGVRYRVRVGPYPSREEAERTQARLKGQGIQGNLVTL